MLELKDLREAPTEQLAAWLGVLAANLRPADLAELRATTTLAPEEALRASVAASELAWVILADGEPITIFGVAPSGCPGSGVVWMVGTPTMDDHPLRLGRISRHCQELMHARYACLWNYIDARNERSMRWLRWTGYRLLEAHPRHGLEGRLFYTFARYQPPCVSPSYRP